MKNDVAIIDIGSSKIVCYIGSPTADGFVKKASGQSKYGGFTNGEWLEPEKLFEAIEFAVRQAEENNGSKISSVFIGVPGEFTTVATSEGSVVFRSKKKITHEDILEVFDKANIYRNVSGLKPISRSSIYFCLDDDKKVVDPHGLIATKLSGLMSYIFVTDYFRDSISLILQKLDITSYEFVSSCLAEALFLLDTSVRDKWAILVDVGYITSSVMLIGGDGLLFMKSFSIGGGHISADLCQVLEISFPVAEQLSQKINLNLEFEENDNYVLNNGVEVKAQLSNDVVKARIDDIAECIVQCFDSCEYEIPQSTALYITGGGLVYTKGAIEYLSKQLQKQVIIAKPLDPQTNRHEYISSFGLLDIATKQIKSRRLFKK